ncbi:2-oxo acid dehydrogenase subunit E2 [Legionella septentrionalis]|uniref:2-oxo acid dehydrogenase subunit E2 n=1 Tax=Legionella septentrionalis TaxID=2498109 RepID=UPI000F8C32D2|nr:2-oxo acid dehydrogenase subunit E2 [Legionella septentrionalis]RUQ94630.1 hypothetical protein ELY11_10870 [Legionella septentrionalis]
MKNKQKDFITIAEILPKLTHLSIPQMGEGLYEVKVLNTFKNPGELIKEDEIIYEIETDKSIVEIESPYEGRLVKWLAIPGDVLKVGDFIAQIEVNDQNKDYSFGLTSSLNKPSKNDNLITLSPRIRAYCKSQGMSQEEISGMIVSHKIIIEKDVDAYLLAKKENKDCMLSYQEQTLSPQQRLLIQRFARGKEEIIPGFINSLLSVDGLRQASLRLCQQYFPHQPKPFISDFQVFAYCVAQTCTNQPKFRSFLMQNNKVREYKNLNLGIAVYTQEGELVIAVIPEADTLCFSEFIALLHEKVKLALEGKEQVNISPHILLSYMGDKLVISGSPVLVPPSVAVLFLGALYENSSEKGNRGLSITFDHRLINGMDSVHFLQSLNSTILNYSMPAIERFPESFSSASLREWLLNQIVNLLKIDIKDINLSESLGLQGFDSIMAVQLAQKINEQFKEVNVPSTLIWHYPTCEDLFQYLYPKISKVDSDLNVNLDEMAYEFQFLATDEIEEVFNS